MDNVIARNVARYRALRANNQAKIDAGMHDYSLIAALLKPSNEVTLHSRFLYSMLNPTGLHYQGSAFLACFLAALPRPLNGLVNIARARVVREKGNIDLMITDGENVLIVENKIHAIDQRYQISRYIAHVQRSIFAGETAIEGRLAIIYLSKGRSRPSHDSQSHVGFAFIEGELRWEGLPNGLHDTPIVHSLPDLAVGTRIPFFHFAYFPALSDWVDRCAEIAPAGDIRQAFREYGKVLERLRNPRGWRKVMSLDSYALSLCDEEQREMYAFMVDAQVALDRFIAARIVSGFVEVFGEQTVAHSGPFHLFDQASVRNWLNRPRGREWSDIGFVIHGEAGEQIAVALGTKYAYVGPLRDQALWSEDRLQETRVPVGDVRAAVRTESDGVYRFLDAVLTLARQCGARVEGSLETRLTQ